MTANINSKSRVNPRVFTEQGVAMLASVLRTSIASKVSIKIMRAFVLMKQYNNVKLIINNNFHDRFIIIDKVTLYHCGASFKDLGKKCFEISKIEDSDILEDLLKRLKLE